MNQTLLVLFENKQDALARIVGLLTARGHNIESLTVAPTEQPSLSRLTVVVTGAESQASQLVKQINKLVHVLDAQELPRTSVMKRELALIKIKVNPDSKTQFMKEVEAFRAKILDTHSSNSILKVSGDDEKLQRFVKALKRLGDVEVIRSGAVALDWIAEEERHKDPEHHPSKNGKSKKVEAKNK